MQENDGAEMFTHDMQCYLQMATYTVKDAWLIELMQVQLNPEQV